MPVIVRELIDTKKLLTGTGSDDIASWSATSFGNEVLLELERRLIVVGPGVLSETYLQAFM